MMTEAGQAHSREHTRARRRRELLDAALRAIGRFGPSVSMQQLAAEAGITKPILYRHFGDQAGLGEALTERFGEMLRAELPKHASPDLRTQLTRQLDATVRVVDAHPGLYEYLTRHAMFGRSAERAAANIAPLAALFRGLREARGLDPSVAEPWAHGMVGMIDRSILWWLRTRELSRSDFVDAMVTLLWNGLERELAPPART